MRELYNKSWIKYKHLNIKSITFVWQQLKEKIMKNSTELNGNWNEIAGKLKQKFGILTDNDLLFAEGKKEEMLGKLQIKLGRTKEELNKIISEF